MSTGKVRTTKARLQTIDPQADEKTAEDRCSLSLALPASRMTAWLAFALGLFAGCQTGGSGKGATPVVVKKLEGSGTPSAEIKDAASVQAAVELQVRDQLLSGPPRTLPDEFGNRLKPPITASAPIGRARPGGRSRIATGGQTNVQGGEDKECGTAGTPPCPPPTTPPPKPRPKVHVAGTLRYADCVPLQWAASLVGSVDGNACRVDGSGNAVLQPMRRIRVEIWRNTGAERTLVRVTDTDRNGNIDIDLPSLTSDSQYNAIIYAFNPAGQANWKDNSATWYWKDLNSPQAGVGGTTIRFDYVESSRNEAAVWNALDMALVGFDYVAARFQWNEAQAAARLSRVSLIPRSAGSGGVTLPAGPVSHIWLSDNAIFSDQVVLHEYAHHLERMNGTYAMQPAFHNGCWATSTALVVPPDGNDASGVPLRCTFTPDTGPLRIVNGPEYAWFEGFPEYFKLVAGRFGGTQVTFTPPGLSYDASCPCTAIGHRNFEGKSIQPNGIEDYIGSALWELTGSAITGANGATMSIAEVETQILDLWFNNLVNRMPTIGDFRSLWNARFPNDTAFAAILSKLGM